MRDGYVLRFSLLTKVSRKFYELSYIIRPTTVSMVDGDLFDKLAMIGSKMKKNPEPFGGIQVSVAVMGPAHAYTHPGFCSSSWLVISFSYHLSPSKVKSNLLSKPRYGTKPFNVPSTSPKSSGKVIKVCCTIRSPLVAYTYLFQIEFIDMLNEMRFGRLTKKSIDKFRSLNREIEYEDGLAPTELLVPLVFLWQFMLTNVL